MTSSHKTLVLVPPLLIGFTFLITLFTMRHQALTEQPVMTPPPEDVVVTEPVPELPPRPAPGPSAPPEEREGDSDLIACTMDAMECPDGSFVGRTGPNCEFRPCPEAGDEILLPS